MEGIRELTECCICSEPFKDPRILSCIHTFCLRCLEQTSLKTGKNPGDQLSNLSCPLCRKEFTIPAEGLCGLQKNFFMHKLMEMTTISRPLSKTVLCEPCMENKSIVSSQVSAQMYCMECKENLCNFCSDQHKKHKMSKHHHVVPFGRQIDEELVRYYTEPNCEEHDGEPVKMFCSDCKNVICMTCFAESHQMHKCSDVKKMADMFLNEIQVNLSKMSMCLLNGEMKSAQLDETKVRFLQEIANSERAVLQRGVELKELVDKHTKSLMDILADAKQSRLKTFEIQKSDLEKHQAMLKSFQSYCSELKSKGSAGDICGNFSQLINRTAELEQITKSNLQRQIPSAKISFVASDLSSFNNIVGIVKDLENFEDIEKNSEKMDVRSMKVTRKKKTCKIVPGVILAEA